MVSPLQRFNDQNKERWVVLQDMPAWILDVVVNFICAIYFDKYNDLRTEVVSSVQTNFRIILEDICQFEFHRGRTQFAHNLNEAFSGDNESALLLLDITVKYVRDYAPVSVPFGSSQAKDSDLLNLVDETLANGSKWTVIHQLNADSGLAEKVDKEIVKLAEEVNQDHLTRAWNLAFQLKPDPEKAVEEAQKAIESTASAAGLTNLTTGVYGGLISDIKANPEKYKNTAKDAYEMHDILNKNENRINEIFSIWVADALDLIQKTHPARHKSKVVEEFSLTPEAAQQAVIIATLVSWIITKKYFYKDNKTEVSNANKT